MLRFSFRKNTINVVVRTDIVFCLYLQQTSFESSAKCDDIDNDGMCYLCWMLCRRHLISSRYLERRKV